LISLIIYLLNLEVTMYEFVFKTCWMLNESFNTQTKIFETCNKYGIQYFKHKFIENLSLKPKSLIQSIPILNPSQNTAENFLTISQNRKLPVLFKNFYSRFFDGHHFGFEFWKKRFEFINPIGKAVDINYTTSLRTNISFSQFAQFMDNIPDDEKNNEKETFNWVKSDFANEFPDLFERLVNTSIISKLITGYKYQPQFGVLKLGYGIPVFYFYFYLLFCLSDE